MNRTIASHISKMFSGNISPPENAELTDWLKQSEENREEFENLRMLWESSRHATTVDGENADAFQLKIQQLIRSDARRRTLLQGTVLLCILISAYLLFYFIAM